MNVHNLMVMFLVGVVAFFVIRDINPGLLSSLGLMNKPVEKKNYMPIVSHMPAPSCFPASIEEILSLRTQSHWIDTVDSMRHHIEEQSIDGLSAFHVGSGNCFMIIKQEDGTFVEMFNPKFKGYSPNNIVRSKETSVACPTTPRDIARSNHVIISYNDAKDGKLMIRSFDDQQALDAQAMMMYLSGKTICAIRGEESDNGINTLKEML